MPAMKRRRRLKTEKLDSVRFDRQRNGSQNPGNVKHFASGTAGVAYFLDMSTRQ